MCDRNMNNVRTALRLLCGGLCACALVACNTTKFVPEGKYLLNDVKVRVEDTKAVTSSELMKYVQQKKF